MALWTSVAAVIAKASAHYSSFGWPLAPPLLKLSETARCILNTNGIPQRVCKIPYGEAQQGN
jgi:hypothetical protein